MTASVIATTVTTPETRHMSVFAADTDLTPHVLWRGLRFTDAGRDSGEFSCVLDAPLSDFPEFRGQAPVLVIDHDTTPEQMFRGFLKDYNPHLVPGYTQTSLRATDHGEALDVFIPGPDPRPAESAKARIGYLWGKYANHYLSPDLTNVTINVASVAAQNFEDITLRRALDMVAAQASSSAEWRLANTSKLHFYTSETNAAPYNIDADAPGGGEIAPTDLEVSNESGVYFNAVYVKGANELGSGYVYDRAAIALAGGSVFSSSLNAPDCSTAAMRDALGNMYLGRVAAVAVRGSFTAVSPDDGWRSGQTFLVTAADANLSAYSTRIARVTTDLLTSDSSKRRYRVEFGRSSGGGSSGGSSDGFAGSIGSGVTGELTDNYGNPILSTAPSSDGGQIGAGIRRQMTSGVANGDFALPPPANNSAITASNPLPNWTLTKTGTAIGATSVTDTAAASGRAIQFAMAAGDATDDTYVEQLLPVNGSQGRSYVNLPSATFKTGPTVSNAQIYITAQYLTQAGATTGSANTTAVTTTSRGADTVVDLQAGAADDGQIPSDAYYLRVRIGLKRNTAATSATEAITLHEVRLQVGGTQILATEGTSPATYGYASVYQQGGTMWFQPNNGGAGGFGPKLNINASDGFITVSTANGKGVVFASTDATQAPWLGLTERTDPGNSGANQAALYVRDNGSGKTQLIVVFSSGAVQILATQP